VAFLLVAGADANAVDNAGLTPLHYAAAVGNERAMRVLIRAGAGGDSLSTK